MPSYTYPENNSVRTVNDEFRSYTVGSCAMTGSPGVTNLTLVESFEHSSATGYRIPGWRKLRNTGKLVPMTPWESYHVQGLCALGQREWCTNGGFKRKHMAYYSGASNPSPWSLNDRWKKDYLLTLVDQPDLEYVVQKAAARIYSSGWDAGTFLAEIGQLRRMFIGIVKKLDRLSRKRKGPGRIKDLGKPEDLWLEGRYGWRTLGYDINDFLEVLSRHNERRKRMRESAGYSYTGTHTDTANSTSDGITRNVTTDFTWVANARGVVIADIDVPDFQFNLLTTAWEVTRLSFVVDWLLNVGQALEATSFLLKVKDYKACGGYRIDFSISGTESLVSKGSNISASTSGSWNGTARYIKRLPMTVGIVPHIKLRLDTWKVLDLLSLLRQAFR
jgi:hypothetical protein